MIGEVRSVRIEVLKTTDIQKQDTVSVVRMASALIRYSTLVADNNLYIEKEQLDTVINVLKYCAAEIKNQNANQFSYLYITGDDVQISCDYSEGLF